MKKLLLFALFIVPSCAAMSIYKENIRNQTHLNARKISYPGVVSNVSFPGDLIIDVVGNVTLNNVQIKNQLIIKNGTVTGKDVTAQQIVEAGGLYKEQK